MFGYPGAGKSTTAQLLHQLTGAVRLSSDAIRLEMFPEPHFSANEHQQLYAELDRRTTELLARGHSVIYDANLNRRQHRDEKYAICKQTGAIAKLIWVQSPRDLAKQRAIAPERQHLVPRNESASDMFDRIASVMEEPASDEHPIIVSGSHLTPEILKTALGQ